MTILCAATYVAPFNMDIFTQASLTSWWCSLGWSNSCCFLLLHCWIMSYRAQMRESALTCFLIPTTKFLNYDKSRYLSITCSFLSMAGSTSSSGVSSNGPSIVSKTFVVRHPFPPRHYYLCVCVGISFGCCMYSILCFAQSICAAGWLLRWLKNESNMNLCCLLLSDWCFSSSVFVFQSVTIDSARIRSPG